MIWISPAASAATMPDDDERKDDAALDQAMPARSKSKYWIVVSYELMQFLLLAILTDDSQLFGI